MPYPTTQLQPGMTGDAVKQLQGYLVSKGLLTNDQVATGPGVYGPQTQAAVAALQKSLGVDTSGGGVGYFGPKTIAAIQGTTYTTPTPTPVPATPSTINSSNIAPVTPIEHTTPNPVPAYPVGSLDTSVPTPPANATPTETKANDLISSLKALNDSLVGKSAYQTTQEAAAGIPDINATITDLSSKLTGLQNEAKAIPLQLQNDATGRGITAAGLEPIQQEKLRNNAVEALTVSTLLDAAKGQLSTAQAKADAAVAQKYGPIEEQIKSATANLQLILNSPQYTLEEKNRAQQQLDIQNARQAIVDKAKQDAKDVSTVAITAAQYISSFKPTAQYPSASVALDAIAHAKDAVTATQIAVSTGLVKPADTQTQVVEIAGRKLLIDSNTGKTVKDLGAATGSGSGTGTQAERAAAALSQYSNVFVPGAKLPSGVPVLDVNGYLTPEAFKAAIADAPANGLSREQFLQSFGYLITTPDGKISPKYGLTPAEVKIVTGALPGA